MICVLKNKLNISIIRESKFYEKPILFRLEMHILSNVILLEN